MGQHDALGAQNVAYCIDAWNRGFQLVVYNDVAALVGGNSCFFQPQSAGIGHAANGHEQPVGFKDARFLCLCRNAFSKQKW